VYLYTEGGIWRCVLVELCTAMTTYAEVAGKVVFPFGYRDIVGVWLCANLLQELLDDHTESVFILVIKPEQVQNPKVKVVHLFI